MMNGIPKYRSQGITLIEILLVVGLLVILMSFALPSMSGATTSADMRVASENLQYSIRIARNTARMEEASVSMNLLEEPGGAGQIITFASSEMSSISLGNSGMQDHQFNEGIKLVSDFPSYQFDSRGMVMKPGKITLVSMADESVTAEIMVE